jgi:hypothetical protein
VSKVSSVSTGECSCMSLDPSVCMIGVLLVSVPICSVCVFEVCVYA